MNLISLLNKSYDRAIELGSNEYSDKLKGLVGLCNDIKNGTNKINEVSPIVKAYLNEVAATSHIVQINWCENLNLEEKAIVIEECRLMVEVYLGQAILLESVRE